MISTASGCIVDSRISAQWLITQSSLIQKIEIPVLIDKDSMEDRGLSEGDLVNGVTVKEHREILSVISEADATLTF